MEFMGAAVGNGASARGSLLLKVNEECPDFLWVDGDDGASWWPRGKGGVTSAAARPRPPAPAVQHAHIPGPCERALLHCHHGPQRLQHSLQIHCHWLRQDWVLAHFIQVVEPQQDTVEVSLGFSSMAFPETLSVLRVVGAVAPARDAQDLQMKIRGQCHSLLLLESWELWRSPGQVSEQHHGPVLQGHCTPLAQSSGEGPGSQQ